MAISVAKSKAKRELMQMIVKKDSLTDKIGKMKTDMMTITGAIKTKRKQLRGMK